MSWTTLFNQIDRETVILTPNRRLSTYLRHTYGEWKLKSHQNHQHNPKAIPTDRPQSNIPYAYLAPDILPYTSWLRRLWESALVYQKGLKLMNAHQEESLWERIIAETTTGSELLQICSAAKLAINAWHIINEWCLDDLNRKGLARNKSDHLDWVTFKEWLTEYQKRTEKEGLIDQHVLPQHLIDLLAQGQLTKPEKVILTGFDEYSPLQQTLLDAFEKEGTLVEKTDPEKSNDSIKETPIKTNLKTAKSNKTDQHKTSNKIALNNTEDELLTMARWAKAQYDQNPNQSIACVVPSLTELRSQIETLFKKVFNQKNYISLSEERTPPYNISSGEPLSQVPIVHAALRLLELSELKNPIKLISFLLRTPFVKNYYRELSQRALIQRKIESLRQFSISRKHLKALLYKHAPHLGKQFQQFCDELTNQEALPSEWASRFSRQLQQLGWPGDRELNSPEFQSLHRFKELLTEFATLDSFSKPITSKIALTQLNKLATQTTFQRQTATGSIQVLGTLEAAGIHFDKLWIMGLNDTNWPPKAKPNPFIPIAIQRQYNTPHSTAQRELHFAEQLMKRFKISTLYFIASYSLADDDQELLPSPLINSMRALELNDLELSQFQDPAIAIYQSCEFEAVLDRDGPPLSDDEKENIHGGSSIIKEQSACPFRAFATFRLNAKVIDDPTLGLSPAERGSLIHNTLELIWNKIETQEYLLALKISELETIIDDAIKAALHKINPSMHQQKPQFVLIEKERIKKIVLRWLDEEKKRPAFYVKYTEKVIRTNLSKLPLNLKIDRIDQLGNGDCLIIDYKTGNHISPNYWFGERPEDPQMVLYGLTSEIPVNAITFAQIRSDKFKFKGISENDINIEGIKTINQFDKSNPNLNWKSQRKIWQKTMTILADQFLEGDACVNPRDGETTCEYCDLKSFCRYQEAGVRIQKP